MHREKRTSTNHRLRPKKAWHLQHGKRIAEGGGGPPPPLCPLEHRAFVRTADVRTAQAERGASDFCRANRGRVGTTRAALFQKRKTLSRVKSGRVGDENKNRGRGGPCPRAPSKKLGHWSLWKSLLRPIAVSASCGSSLGVPRLPPPRSFFDFLEARPSSASLRPRKGVPFPWDRTAGSSYTRNCGRSFFSRICWGGFFQYPSFRKASFPFTWRKPLCRAHRRTLARRKRETAFSCLSRSHLLSVCLKACPAKSPF